MIPRLATATAALLIAATTLVACGSTDSATDAAEAKGPTRTVKHAMGVTEVPMSPKRVVVLDTDKLDTMVSLGMAPVGAAQNSDNQKWPTYLGSALANTGVAGTTQQPAIEAIIKLKPDLILGTKFRMEQFYDKLSQIAPTVFTELVGITWKENFLLDAEALGKKPEAEKLLATYQERAKKFGDSLGDAAERKVSVIRFRPEEIRMYGPASFCGIVIGDTGLGRPEPQLLKNQEDRRFGELSEENLRLADGDTLFYSAFGEAAAKNQATVTAQPLWKGLPVVKSGHAYNVDDETWMTGIGVTAAGKILDDLEKYLAT
jgi:iron complex transport system substrate-binding protein